MSNFNCQYSSPNCLSVNRYVGEHHCSLFNFTYYDLNALFAVSIGPIGALNPRIVLMGA